jgi:hypothetical protein
LVRTFRTALPIGPSSTHAAAFDNVYDAIYAAAFAGGRAGFNRGRSKTPFKPADLVRALDEVLQPGGRATTVTGAGGFADGILAVQGGLPIHFIGTTGPWIFPTGATAGSRRMGTSYYCFRQGQVELTHYVNAATLANPSLCERP